MAVLDTENAIVGCADGLARRTDAAHYLVIGRRRAGVSGWRVDGHLLTLDTLTPSQSVLTSCCGNDPRATSKRGSYGS